MDPVAEQRSIVFLCGGTGQVPCPTGSFAFIPFNVTGQGHSASTLEAQLEALVWTLGLSGSWTGMPTYAPTCTACSLTVIAYRLKAATGAEREELTAHRSRLIAGRATKGARIGRNASCPCGSGKKYKMCHGRPQQ